MSKFYRNLTTDKTIEKSKLSYYRVDDNNVVIYEIANTDISSLSEIIFKTAYMRNVNPKAIIGDAEEITESEYFDGLQTMLLEMMEDMYIVVNGITQIKKEQGGNNE